MTDSILINSKFLILPYSQYQARSSSLIGFRVGTYVVLKKIGQGSFGSVYLSMQQKTKNLLVIKLLDLKMIQLQTNLHIRKVKRKLVEREAFMMTKYFSQNLVKIVDLFENTFFKLLVIEFCNGGNLENKVKSKGIFDENEAVNVLKQILNGLSELHKNGIIHRDLKPQNIFIHDGVYKIGDFGFSKQLHQKNFQNEIHHTNVGTLCTVAPQVIQERQYGLQADIWSIGVIFYYVLYGKYPFEGRQTKSLLQEMKNKNIFDPKYLPSGVKISQNAKSFILQCLKINSQQRLNWQNIRQHQLFIQQNCEKSLSQNCQLSTYEKTENSVYDQYKEVELQKNNVDTESYQTKNSQDHRVQVSYTEQKIDALFMTMKQFETKKHQLKHILKNHDISWTKLVHFEFLRSEFIIKQIIQPFQFCSENLLFSRQVIQILFLVACRCFEDISEIKSQASLKNNNIVLNFAKMIDTLHHRLYEKLQKYSGKLLNKENQKIEIIKSKIFGFIQPKEQKQKNIFFARMRAQNRSKFTPAYTKSQQVCFTQKMINQCIKMISRVQDISQRTVNFMRNFDKIYNISFKDVGNVFFRTYVTNLYQNS